MGKLRYFPFYADEWLAGTIGMGLTDRGVYITICALIYSHGGPVRQDLVRQHAGVHGNALKASLMRLAEAGKISFSDGFLTQKRCANELEKAQKRSTNGSENVAKRWQTNGLADGVVIPPSNANQNQNQKDIAPDGAIPPVVPPTPTDVRRGTRLTPDWMPDLADCQFAAERGLDVNEVAGKFRDHWVAKAGADACKRDWHATWRNWCRREPAPSPHRENGHARRSPAEKLYAGGFLAAEEYDRQNHRDDGDPSLGPLLDG